MPAFSSTDELTVFSTALAGQYEVEREIGRGGMGVVYLARDLRLDRMVALKTLPMHLAGDTAIRERFLREARTAARLSHPNIVPVHRADEVGGQVFFVMGFIDGDSLAARLASGPLSPKETVPILRDVAAALGHAHRSGVIHRDVKTENILLDRISGRAMVTDFGIALLGEAAPLTATGQMLGTVYYLSPEQVAGEAVDARSDIYALGVVAYAALSGQFPFDAPVASAVIIAHVNKQPMPLAAVAPHVPASLASIVDRCLAKNPAHRYQTCADLDMALSLAQPDADRVSSSQPPSAKPLISRTEAQAVLGRAAELSDSTRPFTRPADPAKRDARKDAARKTGFRTGNLRNAAREAGIAEEYVQHALIEHGLVDAAHQPASPDAPVVVDLSAEATMLTGEPAQISYETVVDGEMSERDFDLLVDVIRRRSGGWGNVGTMATVGRSFTWSSQSNSGRRLQVSIFPRNGRTTIRVFESMREMYGAIYGGLIGAVGGGLGSLAFGLTQAIKPWPGHDANITLGLGIWFGIAMPLSFILARFFADRTSEKRQESLLTMIQELAERAKESIDFNKD